MVLTSELGPCLLTAGTPPQYSPMYLVEKTMWFHREKDLAAAPTLTLAISTHTRKDEEEACGWEATIPKAALEAIEFPQRCP